jgi:urease accessory protein UreH
MAGRSARGEAWQFSALAHDLRLDIASKLAYLERYRLTPRGRSTASRWAASDAQYLATVLMHHPRVTEDLAEALHRRLDEFPDVHAAVDAVESRLIVGRLAAAMGPAFATVRAQLRHWALERIFERPNLVGRK